MTRHCLTVLALAALFATLAPAQAPPPEGTVAGTGTSTLKRPPEMMRMHIELTAKGKDLKEALAKLKERREAARIQLATLGAAKDTIQFGEPTLSTERVDQRRQMEMMVRQRVASAGKKPGKQADPVIVTATLKADWPLKSVDAEELMLTTHALQEKIKAADLAGMKDAKPLTPQEEELAEEMAALGHMNPGMMNQPQPGEPMFQFVSKVSEAERSKALAEAFQKAKAEAGQLAQAAGMELGTLRQLQHVSAQESEPEYPNPYAVYGYPQYSRPRSIPGDPDNRQNEAVGTQPGKVTLRLTVTAAFALQGPPKAPPK